MALPNQNFSKHLILIYSWKIYKHFVVLVVILKFFNVLKNIFWGDIILYAYISIMGKKIKLKEDTNSPIPLKVRLLIWMECPVRWLQSLNSQNAYAMFRAMHTLFTYWSIALSTVRVNKTRVIAELTVLQCSLTVPTLSVKIQRKIL